MAAWLGAATVHGQDAPPRPLAIVTDARPIELNPASKDDHASSPQVSEGTLRFSPPAAAPGTGQETLGASSGGVLRWRGRQGEAAAVTTGFSPRPAEAAWQDRTHRTDPAILPAAHQNEPAPFRDPFNDNSPDPSIRLLPPTGEQLGGSGMVESDDVAAPRPPEVLMVGKDTPIQKGPAAQPAQRRPLFSGPRTSQKPTAERTLPPLPPGPSFMPDIPLPGAGPAPAAPPDQLPPPDAPPREAPGAVEPLRPIPPSLGPPPSVLEHESRPTDTTCRRIYNDRNCCDEEDKCNAARKALRENSITRISLDITAPFMPDAESLEEEREARESRLRQIPERHWRNRTGQVVAAGRLHGIKNRRITVAGADGQLVDVRLGELSDDDLCFLAAWWGVPTECTLGDDRYVPRSWELVSFHWKASALCHKPLYFEETAMERYGHSMGPLLDPIHSGAHFFKNVALLPYHMGINPPHECRYALGYYRPGNCAPWLVPPVPISVRGGLLQAGVVLGGVYLIP